MSKVAVVTGSNKGLGYGTVKLLLKQHPDWTVYLTARDEKRGQEAIEQLKQETGGLTALFNRLDVDSLESIQAFRDHLKATHPEGIHVLVNNAGIMPRIANDNGDGTYTFDQAAVRSTVKTGHFGTKNVLNELFPLVTKGGFVVNVSSGLGQSFYAKCAPKIQERFRNATTLAELDDLVDEYTSVATADLVKAGWMVVDPSALFHDMFRMADMYPTALTHLTIAKMTEIFQKLADQADNGVIVNAVCPGRVKSDMNPTGLHTPEEAARFVLAGIDLPADTTNRGAFISQGVAYESWIKVPFHTGESK